MKTNSLFHSFFHLHKLWSAVVVLGLLLSLIANPSPCRAAEQSMSDKVSQAAEDTSEAVKDASRATEEAAQDLWDRIDANRLKNRTPDEIAAWVIMGVLVGAIAGMATSMRSTGLGRVGQLLLGLAGAFFGSMVVKVAALDFGWGLAIIRYEELLFAFGGAILLLVIVKLVRSGTKKKPAVK